MKLPHEYGDWKVALTVDVIALGLIIGIAWFGFKLTMLVIDAWAM